MTPRQLRKLLILCLTCATISSAQAPASDEALLAQARAKYDTPFTRNLQSFDCAIDFSWKQHWKETYRVGDEGTDAEIEKSVQPLHFRVTVTRSDAVVSSGLSNEQEMQLPHGGMAAGLLEHAVRLSLGTWLAAANNAILPPVDTPVQVTSSASGYTLGYKVRKLDVSAKLTHDLALEGMAAKDSDGDRQDFRFQPGPQGFLLAWWIMGEGRDYKDGNRLRFDYSYQTVDGFQLPKQAVVVRESHYEVWRYTLTDCKVMPGK